MLDRLSVVEHLFNPETRRERLHILVLSVIGGLLGAVIVMLLQTSLQRLELGGTPFRFLIFYLAVIFSFGFVNFCAMSRLVRLIETLIEIIRCRIANQIRQSELSRVETLDEAEIYVTMTKGSTGISDGARAVLHALQAAIILSICLTYTIWLSPWLTMAIGIAALFVGVAYDLCYRLLIRNLMHSALATEKRLVELFGHCFHGFKELRMSSEKRNDLYGTHLAGALRQLLTHRVRAARLFADHEILVSAAFFVLLGSVGFVLSNWMPLSMALAAEAIIVIMWHPIHSLCTTVPQISNAYVVLERQRAMEKALSFCEHPRDQLHHPGLEQGAHFDNLEVRDICFRYPGDEQDSGFRLGPVSLSLQPGQITFLCGWNGSGKTTLTKLLCGLYAPTSGEFVLDGRPVRMDAHRHLWSSVFSDFHLFNRLMGVPPTDPDVMRAWLARLELQGAEWDGERFQRIDLSTGQRKRLALLTAILEKRPLLVFDEWAAEQPPRFRTAFYENILPELKASGRSIIVVTHDEQFHGVADQKIVLENGQVVSGMGPMTGGRP